VAYDAIRFANVLSHLVDPTATVRRLRERLAPGGVFWFEEPLLVQPSLVLGFAVTVATARRWLSAGRRRPASGPPYELTLQSLASFRRWLGTALGASVAVATELHEDGWPYANARADSLGGALRRGVGLCAVHVGGSWLGARLELGNRVRACVWPDRIGQAWPATAPGALRAS
jgi:hypothetical protein